MDSVAILSEFLARGVRGVLIGSICDAEVVALANSAGVGGVIEDFELGGKTDALHGPSLRVQRAKVVSQSDGDYTLEGAMMTGSKLSCGPTAVLELPSPDGVTSSTVVVCSWRECSNGRLGLWLLPTLTVDRCCKQASRFSTRAFSAARGRSPPTTTTWCSSLLCTSARTSQSSRVRLWR